MLYGSGLRNGFANTQHLPFYTQLNASITQNLGSGFEGKFSIINLFDRVYQIRDGSGIGVSAPQYGQRRGFFLQISKEF